MTPNTYMGRFTVALVSVIFLMCYVGMYIGKSKKGFAKIWMSLLCFCTLVILARLTITYTKAAAMNFAENVVENAVL